MKKLAYLFFIQFFLFSCADTKTKSQSKPALIFDEIKLSLETQQACATDRETLSRRQALEKPLLKNLLKNAADHTICVEKLADTVEEYFLTMSEELKSNVDDKVYDVIVIGAGPQAAVLVNNLAQIEKLKVLIVEKNKTFASHFKSVIYELTVNEAENESPYHPFPNAPTSLNHDVMRFPAGPRKPLALELWQQIAFTLFASHADYLTDDLIAVNAADATVDYKRLYNLQLKSGLTVRGQSIVFATGLGEPTVQLDEASMALLKSPKNLAADAPPPSVMFFDDFIQWSENKRVAKMDVMNFFQDKVVGIIGASAGGEVLKKYFVGAGPLRAYQPNDGLVERLYWFGSREESKGKIKAIASHAKSLELMQKNDEIKINILSNDMPIEVDFVVVAGGYKHGFSSVLKNLIGDNSPFSLMELVKHTTTNSENIPEVIAKELALPQQKPEFIFFIGAAMQETQATSIYNESPRTAAFAKVLVKDFLQD